MTRRLAITILLTVWASIVVAGVAAWFSARAVLLVNLDASIEKRAMMLPEVTRFIGGPPAVFPQDRYLVTGALNRRLNEPAGPRRPEVHPQRVDAGFADLPEGRFRWVAVRFSGEGGSAPMTVVYSAPAAEYDRVLRWLAAALTGCGAAAGAVAALAAARLARMALRPLSQTADAIGSIDESRLDRRIDAAALPAELRPMAERLNEMVARLQEAFERRRRFLADASHELRTPVAALITTMEVALRRPRPEAELSEAMRTCLAEARHMRELVQALLRHVRAEDRAGEEPPQLIDAGQLLNECARLTGPLAAARQVRLIPPTAGQAQVRAEPGRLRSVVLNLVSNAIEYNRPGGMVEMSARADAGSIEIVVKDDGPGIAPNHLPNLFLPFYRATATRGADGHLGLGLSLVDSHVKAMGGECCVETTVGVGTTFRVRLPAADESCAGNGTA